MRRKEAAPAAGTREATGRSHAAKYEAGRRERMSLHFVGILFEFLHLCLYFPRIFSHYHVILIRILLRIVSQMFASFTALDTKENTLNETKPRLQNKKINHKTRNKHSGASGHKTRRNLRKYLLKQHSTKASMPEIYKQRKIANRQNTRTYSSSWV